MPPALPPVTSPRPLHSAPTLPLRLFHALAVIVLALGAAAGCRDTSSGTDGGILRLRIVGDTTQYDVTQWPTIERTLSSPFGPRLKASEAFRYDFHRGIDIPADRGAPVSAIADGEIYRAYVEGDPGSPYPGGGNVVITRHTFDTPLAFHGMTHTRYYALYLHLDTILVDTPTPGGPYQPVAMGAPIGTVGQSGQTTFNHLHFEVRIGTTCSREYQRSNPGTGCATYFGTEPRDPHVNPLLLLNYPDGDAYEVQVLQTSPLQIRILADRDELDFNQIRVRYRGTERDVNFNDRTGIDPNDIDNPDYGGVVISPAQFRASSNRYEITFEFTGLAGYDWIEMTDIRGKGIRILHSRRSTAWPAEQARSGSDP